MFSQNVICGDETYVEFHCSDMQVVENRYTKAIFKLDVTSPKTLVGKVEFHKGSLDGTFTTKVEMLSINTGQKSVLFVPAGIKRTFPELTAFQIIHSGLMHLEQDDMQQFGSDLTHVNFWDNSLTALQGDIFVFNENLDYIGLHHNLLVFIDPTLFQNLKFLMKISYVQILNSKCIDKNMWSRDKNEWTDHGKCNDEASKIANLKRISERQLFFYRGDCVNQCMCNGNQECFPHTGFCSCSQNCRADRNGHCQIGNCYTSFANHSCSTKCPEDLLSIAKCDLFTKQFKCRPGYVGSMCERCEDGFFGEECREMCSCETNEKCSNIDGSCETLTIQPTIKEPCNGAT